MLAAVRGYLHACRGGVDVDGGHSKSTSQWQPTIPGHAVGRGALTVYTIVSICSNCPFGRRTVLVLVLQAEKLRRRGAVAGPFPTAPYAGGETRSPSD
jgi:hypothetical protein